MVVTDAGQGHFGFAKKCGELVEVFLFPAIAEFVVVAFHAVDADA